MLDRLELSPLGDGALMEAIGGLVLVVTYSFRLVLLSTSRGVLDAPAPARDHARRREPDMLAVAHAASSAASIEQTWSPISPTRSPTDPFDLVVSALAVHHLDGPRRSGRCSRACATVLAPGGRFALADVVVPVDPADQLTPLSPGYDQPDSAADLLAWLRAAGFPAEAVWANRDLAVFVADARLLRLRPA